MTIVPSIVLIKKEQNVLEQRLKNAHQLHDLLIEELNEVSTKNKVGENNNLDYEIVYKQDYIEVCGTWTNLKKVQEDRCYYGKKEAI